MERPGPGPNRGGSSRWAKGWRLLAEGDRMRAAAEKRAWLEYSKNLNAFKNQRGGDPSTDDRKLPQGNIGKRGGSARGNIARADPRMGALQKLAVPGSGPPQPGSTRQPESRFLRLAERNGLK